MFLGIDIGTYESKGVIANEDGSVVAQAVVEHDLSVPRPGWAEADADNVWWNDFARLCRQLLQTDGVRPQDIECIACSAIGPCVLPVDAAGTPLRPAILYGIDTRSDKEVQWLTQRLGSEWILENTGSSLSSQAAGPKILWIKNNEPQVWAKTAKIMTSTSYLVYRLTDEIVIDHYTAAAYGPLYNLHSKDWDETGLQWVCDRDLLPELGWSMDVAGAVSAAAADATGLCTGTPVTFGTADAAAEAVSAGVAASGDTMLMYGSTLFFIQICDELVSTDRLWPTVYLVPDTYALAAGMSTAGALLRWFRDTFAENEKTAEERGGENAFQALSRAASEVAAGSEGLLVLPHFSGERSPLNNPRARGLVAGLNLAHGKAHIYRASIEGIAFGIRQTLAAMADAGAPPGRLVAVGGGVKDRLWSQIVSDVTGFSQDIQPSTGASFGDCMIARAAAQGLQSLVHMVTWVEAGEQVIPDARNRSVYDRRYSTYLELYHQTKAISRQLSEERQ